VHVQTDVKADVVRRFWSVSLASRAQSSLSAVSLSMSFSTAVGNAIGLARECKWAVKTEMCKFFARGCCDRGDKCTFAHSDGELRKWVDKREFVRCFE
jgi:hypothetical protein